jgi:hypothetical protein
MDPIDLLLDELIADGVYPPKREVRINAAIRTRRAFLESDRELLKVIAAWPKDRDYKVDPLPELIADAWADHLFGEDLTLTAAKPADDARLAFVLEENGADFAGGLHSAERVVVGEGESWWRVYVDLDVADAPLLEWHSRDVVIPLYIGRRLMAAALVTTLAPKGRSKAVYRHFEVHEDGGVEHVLFKGTDARIGQTIPLEDHPETAELAASLGASRGQGQRWDHGLPMLMGRVTNGRGIDRDLNVGVSDFDRVADFLLDLNEAATIGAENARLTAKRRMVVSEDAVRNQGIRPDLVDNGDGGFVAAGAGTVDVGADVLVVSRLDAELGASSDGPFKVLEYSFDAEALIAYKRDLVETALTRVGLTPSYVGVDTRSSMGNAMSGTARRLMLTPTIKAGNGKARPWDDALPECVSLMVRLDHLPRDLGGFGRPWADELGLPAVERANTLPTDEVEEAGVEAVLVGAGVRSVYTSVTNQHPDWDEAAILEEVKRIREDRAAAGPRSILA